MQQVRHDPAAAGREIASVLGLEEAAFLEQVHGGDVLTCEQGGCAGFADGLVTGKKGLAVLGKSGDCPIVLIADRQGRAVGFAHASWRATVAGIVPTTIRRMVDLGCRPNDLVAGICPSAGPCCYEVGDEVRAAALEGIGPHAAAFFRPSGWQRQAQLADGFVAHQAASHPLRSIISTSGKPTPTPWFVPAWPRSRSTSPASARSVATTCSPATAGKATPPAASPP